MSPHHGRPAWEMAWVQGLSASKTSTTCSGPTSTRTPRPARRRRLPDFAQSSAVLVLGANGTPAVESGQALRQSVGCAAHRRPCRTCGSGSRPSCRRAASPGLPGPRRAAARRSGPRRSAVAGRRVVSVRTSRASPSRSPCTGSCCPRLAGAQARRRALLEERPQHLGVSLRQPTKLGLDDAPAWKAR